MYGVVSSYIENKNFQNKLYENEVENVKLLYKIYKKQNVLDSFLIKNEHYVDNSKYINEFKQSTPLFSSKDDEAKVLQFILTFKFFTPDEIKNNANIQEKIEDLDYSQSMINIKNYNIELFGIIDDKGYVLISKNISHLKKVVDILETDFLKSLLYLVVFILMGLYFYKESKKYKSRKKDLELEYKILEKNAKELAFIDSLTQIDSRLKFSISLNELIEITRRFESSFCLILFDIDNFKKVNDNFGHDYGDIVLKSIAKCVKETIRKTDVFARWGGEEFVLLLPATSYEDAILFTNKIRKKIAQLKYEKINQVTCSFGVVDYLHGDDEESMLKRVDKFLYQAKHFGKNCVKYEER